MPLLAYHNPKPARFLVENSSLLPKGKVLDIAMSAGRNAIYLAKMGFEVCGVDIDPKALSSAERRARQAGVTIRTELADLETGYQIEKEAYDTIICFFYLHRPLIRQIKEGLRPGGMVVYETFTVDQAQFGKPRNPAHLLEHNELLRLFSGFYILRYREGLMEEDTAIASLIGQKV